jgi:hypothetical protein
MEPTHRLRGAFQLTTSLQCADGARKGEVWHLTAPLRRLSARIPERAGYPRSAYRALSTETYFDNISHLMEEERRSRKDIAAVAVASGTSATTVHLTMATLVAVRPLPRLILCNGRPSREACPLSLQPRIGQLPRRRKKEAMRCQAMRFQRSRRPT